MCHPTRISHNLAAQLYALFYILYEFGAVTHATVGLMLAAIIDRNSTAYSMHFRHRVRRRGRNKNTPQGELKSTSQGYRLTLSSNT